MYFGLNLFLLKLLARKLCGVSYVHFPILVVFCMPFELKIVSNYKTVDHRLRLSRRDFPSTALDIRYTSLYLQDFHLTFI